MATITFAYRSKKTDAVLEARLSFRIRGKNLNPKTGKEMPYSFYTRSKIAVSKSFWNEYQKSKKFKDIDKQNRKKEVDDHIHNLRTFVLERLSRTDLAIVDKKWFENAVNEHYVPKTEPEPIPKDLVSFIDYYIEERGNDITPASITKFNVIKHKMQRLQSYRRNTIMIAEIGESFKKEFVDYYTSEQYSQNTMHRELGLIKTFCKYARKKGIDVHPELSDLKLRKKPVDNIYLSFAELELIEKASMKHDYQENARDWLIISCYTGQRVSDFLRFTSDMIRVENGKKLLEFQQKKTKKLMTIPLHPKVLEILDKRNGEFPRAISDQRYNEYIKKVCELAELKEKVEGKKQIDIEPKSKESKIRAVSGTFEKWELVTSHIGRRSFATNFYGDIPTSYLIYVTGHSSESMFLNYIGKSNKDLAIELTNYF